MLVLSLKRGQSLEITFPDGSTGRLHVRKSKRGEIKLAIQAPPSVRFLRSTAVAVDSIPQLAAFRPVPAELQEA
jgi:sRNA-binding carbon storage regulator CsrA